MKYNPSLHHRRSIRLKGYDYAFPGAYFVTLVAHQRQCLFGQVVGEEVRLTVIGDIVEQTWLGLVKFFPIELVAWVVMPNHFHGIIGWGEASAGFSWPKAEASVADASPLPTGTASGSLGAIIQNFKSITTRRINRLRHKPGGKVWQRNYYEHIIRNQAEMEKIAAYIETNPSNWLEDEEYPG